MLQPKRVKYRRPHIIKYEGHCKGGRAQPGVQAEEPWFRIGREGNHHAGHR